MKDNLIDIVIEFYNWTRAAESTRQSLLRSLFEDSIVASDKRDAVIKAVEFSNKYYREALAHMILKADVLTDGIYDLCREPYLEEVLDFACVGSVQAGGLNGTFYKQDVIYTYLHEELERILDGTTTIQELEPIRGMSIFGHIFRVGSPIDPMAKAISEFQVLFTGTEGSQND